MADEHAPSGEHAEHDAHSVNYWAIFGILSVLTVVSVVADLLGDFGAIKNAIGAMSMKFVVGFIVLTVACFKATFVMLYFMHLKFEGKWKFVLLAPTMVLALAMVAALSAEIGVHYYTLQTPQTVEAAAQAAHPAAPPGHH